MRVIAGKYKGMTIPMPKKGNIRPTTDRSKEALFSIINSRFNLEKCAVLDLFTGSAGVAFEFASRYAQSVVSVEVNRRVQRQNADFAKEKNISEIRFVSSNVFSFLKKQDEPFDIIFADPPYDLKKIQELPELVFSNKLLSPGGLLIIEHHSTLQWSNPHKFESRPYGQSVFSFFQFDVPLEE